MWEGWFCFSFWTMKGTHSVHTLQRVSAEEVSYSTMESQELGVQELLCWEHKGLALEN